MQVESLIEELSAEWKFSFVRSMPQLSFNFVAQVKRLPDNSPAILKMSPGTGSLANEIQWLKAYQNKTPEIVHVDLQRNCFLMECCQPGSSLQELSVADDKQATRVLGQMIKNLHQCKVIDLSFKHLSELIPDLSALAGSEVDAALLAKAQGLFVELTANRNQDVLLHGDLHHDNILCSGNEWKVIDPHGYMGDPVAETGVMIYNPLESFPSKCSVQQVIDYRLRILSEQTGYDPKRIKAWFFCMTMLSAAWNARDFGSQAKKEIELATLIDQLKI